MKSIILSLVATCCIATATAQKPIKLFNGKNFDGWALFTKELSHPASKEFTIEDKVINLSGAFGYIYTTETYANYKLTFEWRWDGEGSNSGLFLNMSGLNKAWPNCYEVQLQSGRAGNIILSGDVTADIKNKYIKGLNSDLEKPIGEWNSGEVICTHDKITIYINGEKQNELTGMSCTEGHIGLQSEGKPIQFRNITLLQL